MEKIEWRGLVPTERPKEEQKEAAKVAKVAQRLEAKVAQALEAMERQRLARHVNGFLRHCA